MTTEILNIANNIIKSIEGTQNTINEMERKPIRVKITFETSSISFVDETLVEKIVKFINSEEIKRLKKLKSEFKKL